MSHSETTILKTIQIGLSKIGARMFRNNNAKAYAGNNVIFIKHPTTYRLYPGDIVIQQGRIIHAGLGTGSSDLIGIYQGRFVACEVKATTGRATPEQIAFIDMVNNNGGIGFIAHSEDEAITILRSRA